jgi:hypothetical protein
LVALLAVPALVACGGKSEAEKATEAAAHAKAACGVFTNFHPPQGDDLQAQIDATKATYGAFLEAADLARQAAELDPQWKALQTSAEQEAAGFEVLAKAAGGATQLDQAAIGGAVTSTQKARVVFLAQCAKADPKHFSSPTPSAPPTSDKTHKR